MEEIKRKLNPFVDIKIEGNKIILEIKNTRKIRKKNFGTMKAHVKNMIKGLTEGFIYKLQIAFVHFPMNVNIDKEKNELVIKNFLGEKTERRIKIPEGITVEIKKDIIEVKGADIEKAGQFSANVEKIATPSKKDRRIFQDGIYIIEKPSKSYM